VSATLIARAVKDIPAQIIINKITIPIHKHDTECLERSVSFFQQALAHTDNEGDKNKNFSNKNCKTD